MISFNIFTGRVLIGTMGFLLSASSLMATPSTNPVDSGVRKMGMVMTLHERKVQKETSNVLQILSSEPMMLESSEEIPSESPTKTSPMNLSESPGQGTVTAVNSFGEKELYLTFDDGPVRGTENVLKVLREEGVRATMFLVGRHVEKHPGLYRRMRGMPNLLIANHTYTHANGHYRRFYSDTFRVMSDIEHAQLVIGGERYLRLAGRNVWRLPEVRRNDGALPAVQRRNEFSKYEVIAEEGFFVYGWDVEWRFDHATGRPLADAWNLADRIERVYRSGRTVQRGKVVLLAHDFMFRDGWSVAELRRFIRIMREKGWSFRTIDRYSRHSPGTLRVARYYGKARPDRVAALSSKPLQKGMVGRYRTERSSAKIGAPVSAHYLKPKVHRERGHSLEAKLNDAIRAYRAEEVAKLVARGARINEPDASGRLAINTAIKANSITLVKKLLAYGADLHRRDGHGATALRVARQYQRQEIEKYLIQYSLSQKKVRHLAAAQGPSIPSRKRVDPLSALR